MTGNLIKAELRDGPLYSSNGVVSFMQPIFDECFKEYPDINLFMRGDSRFSTPDLFRQSETNSISYAIHLKAKQDIYRLSTKQIDTIRLKLIKIAPRVIKSERYIIFKLCRSCPYKK